MPKFHQTNYPFISFRRVLLNIWCSFAFITLYSPKSLWLFGVFCSIFAFLLFETSFLFMESIHSIQSKKSSSFPDISDSSLKKYCVCFKLCSEFVKKSNTRMQSLIRRRPMFNKRLNQHIQFNRFVRVKIIKCESR